MRFSIRGELEARNEARHAREGLELPERTMADLNAEAQRLGVRVAKLKPKSPAVARART